MGNKIIFGVIAFFFLLVIGMFFVMNDSLQSLVSTSTKETSSLSLSPLLEEDPEEDSMYMISHSEYWSDEEGQIISTLRNWQGSPITDANCTVDILYPDKTFFVNDAPTIFNVDSYYYNFTTPSIEGVYEYKVSCIYAGGSKTRSSMNSFHLSPALNFIEIAYDNLSNQIADLEDLENAHFNNITHNLTKIKEDTEVIRSTMATSTEVQSIRTEIVEKLDDIANFCGTNYTSASLLCQWVNETRERVESVEEDITIINESIEVIVNNTITIIENTEIIINQTANITYLINLTVGDLLDESLQDIRDNISDMKDDLEIIKNNTNITINLLEDQLTILYANFSDLRNDIASLSTDILTNNQTMTERFNSLDIQMDEVISQVIQIENKLDCNNTINTICDMLDEIEIEIIQVNVTANYIQEYLEGIVTEYLLNISNQTTGVGQYLFKGVSEIDLFIDSQHGDVTRAGGTTQFDIELVSPINSTGLLELYIDNVLKSTSLTPLSYSQFMTEGTYTIKAKFIGDGNYSLTTEYAMLTITSTNNIPTASLILPTENESVDLPYNITFTVTDDNSDNVSLLLYKDGVFNLTIITNLENTDTYHEWDVTTPSDNYTMMLLVCEEGTSDLYCVNDTVDFFLNQSCVIGWEAQYESCLTNNTRYKTYTDLSSCGDNSGVPIDNGTFVYCDYCISDIIGPYYSPLECPSNETQLRYYSDNNYNSCCLVTGFVSDCEIDYPPYENQTINCSFLQDDISLELDETPFLTDRIDILADINISNATKCWTYVESENGLLQTNPQQEEFSNALAFSKRTETREYFTPVQGKINAYYTKENLIPDKDFILGISCALDNGTVVSGEKYINPQYQDLRKVTARSVWGVNEMPILLWVVVFFMIMFLLLLYYFKR